MRAASRLGWIVALGLLSAAPAAWALESAAGLSRELSATGRAEATLRYVTPSPTGSPRAVHARLALEAPDRARLDVSSTGEKIVARADGGEWLQPSLRQMLRFRPQQATAALRWWRVLLGEERSARERRVAPNRYVVTLLDARGAPEDSAEVTVGARGLPVRLVTPAGDPEAQVFRLEGWQFTRPRGESAFRLKAPAGFETVELP